MMRALMYIKAFKRENGTLTSLFATAPWAKRTYIPERWQNDLRGFWVFPVTPDGITSAIYSGPAYGPWEIWACYGSAPFCPPYTPDALERDSITEPEDFTVHTEALAVKHIYPIKQLAAMPADLRMAREKIVAGLSELLNTPGPLIFV